MNAESVALDLRNDTFEPTSEPFFEDVVAGFGMHPLQCDGLLYVMQ